MPAVIAQGLDYSARRLTGKQIREAGFTFVNRYLWFPGQRFPALTAEECADLIANGVEPHAIYEQNTNDPAGGFAAGQRMASQAVTSAVNAGLPNGHTIYMCADAWLSTHGISIKTAMEFLDGARAAINGNGYLLGAYGFADFVYAAQDGGHADRFWLCGAESGVRDGIHHYQWNNGRVHVDGLECDLNKQYLPMKEEVDDVSGVEVWTTRLKSGLGYTATAEEWVTETSARAERMEVQLANLAGAMSVGQTAVLAAIGNIPTDEDGPMTDEQVDRAATRISMQLNTTIPESVLALVVQRLGKRPGSEA